MDLAYLQRTQTQIVTYNRNAIAELVRRGYKTRHIAIIMGCHEDTAARLIKQMQDVEPTLKFLTTEQKKRMYVLDKCLRLKPLCIKWCSNDYYFITLLRFLLVPKDIIKAIYKAAPQIQVAQACKEVAPKLKSLDFHLLEITSEEYELFVFACYRVINDPTKWR